MTTEWIKFAGSDVYHLAVERWLVAAIFGGVRQEWTEARCKSSGYVTVRFVGTPEPLCPRCLAISQQQEEVTNV